MDLTFKTVCYTFKTRIKLAITDIGMVQYLHDADFSKQLEAKIKKKTLIIYDEMSASCNK